MGARIEGDDDALRRAPGYFTEAPVFPLRTRAGWRFAAPLSHWESEDFLGRVRQVARATHGRLGRGAGRVVVIDHGRLEGAPSPEGTVLDAAFADDQHGIALVEPGVVLLTDDGGAHWRSPAVPPLGTVAVIASDAMRWSIQGEQRSEPHAFEGADATARLFIPVPIDAPQRGYPLHHHAMDYTSPQVRGYADRERRAVVLQVDSDHRPPHRFVVYDLVVDEVRRELEAPTPCDEPAFFGADRIHVLCHGGVNVVYALGDDGAWRERMALRGEPEGGVCAASESGRSIVCGVCCGTAEVCPQEGGACVSEGDGPPTQRSIVDGHERWRSLGYDGETLLWLREAAELSDLRVRRDGATAMPLVRDPPPGLLRVEAVGRRLGRDGRLRVIARDEGGRPLVFEGVPGERFTERAPPSWRDEVPAPQRAVLCSPEGEVLMTRPEPPDDSDRSRQPRSSCWISAADDAQWREVPSEPCLSYCFETGTETWGNIGWRTFPPSIARGVGEHVPPPPPGTIPYHPERVFCSGRRGTHLVLHSHNAGAMAAAYAGPPVIGFAGRTFPLAEIVGSEEMMSSALLFHSAQHLVIFERTTAQSLVLDLPAVGSMSVLWRDRHQLQRRSEWWASTVARVGQRYASLTEQYALSPSFEPVTIGEVHIGAGSALHETWRVVGFDAPGWYGAFVLDDDAGFLRVHPDWTALVSVRGSPYRVISRGVPAPTCGPRARGDFVINVIQIEDRHFHYRDLHYANLRMRLDRESLCFYGLTFGEYGPLPRDEFHCERIEW